jgi:hypothetical protein
MLFMNEYEIGRAADHHARHPVLSIATRMLGAFMEDVNSHNDGCGHWTAAVRGAKSLIRLVQGPTTDVTEQALRQILVPTKSLLHAARRSLRDDAPTRRSLCGRRARAQSRNV